MNIIHIETVDSTNTYLKRLIDKEVLEEGTVIVTNNQTAGKGQRGNSWESEAGKNITCSMLLYPTFLPVQRFFLLSEVVSLGVKETLDAYTDRITIKWPNDIYHNERKIAGILIENGFIGNEFNLSIAGIGLNINQEHFLSDAPNSVSLKQITGKSYDTEVILEELSKNIFKKYLRLMAGLSDSIILEYHKALYRKTGFHRYEDHNGIFNAYIDFISEDGLLHLVTDLNEERIYAFKDVRFINFKTLEISSV